MKPTKSKKQIREQLEDEVQKYLAQGGSVTLVAQGVSGRDDNRILPSYSDGDKPQQDRTPLTEVVQTLEMRKRGVGKTVQNVNKGRPKRKLIRDDFGEPVRWVWED